MQIQKDEIIELFKKNWVEGYINITTSNSKSLEYTPLHDEVSLDSSLNITTNITIIQNHKKASFSIDGYSFLKLKNAFLELKNIVDFSEYDEDIVQILIKDEDFCDFSNKKIDDIWFDYMQKEFEKFKNYNFKEWIKIEWFEIDVISTTHTHINSLWAYKTQSDNESSVTYVLFWEYENNREDDYEQIEKKDIPKVILSDIEKLETRLLNKIQPSSNTIKSWFYNITLDRDVVIDFLQLLIWWLSAESMREGTSMLSKYSIWDKIISDKITIINNPFLEWYTWNILFDKEWITQKKTTLFEKWVLKSKFYDYKNARKEGLENLWNSKITNIEIIWETSPKFLDETKILITNLMAYHTVDSSTWKFSLNGEWYLIENWEKKWFIKNISLSWSVIWLFENIIAIWDDFKDTWNYKVPSITFENQEIIWNT